MNTTHRTAQTASALGLALMVTLATLGSLNHLADQNYGTALSANTAVATQQAQAATPAAARRG